MKSTVFILLAIAMGSFQVEGKKRKDDPDFVCSAKGRFSDHTDPECKRYHLCSIGAHGKWTRTSYDCPQATVFDRVAGFCSSTAVCKNELSDSDLSISYDGDEFVCKKAGRFDDITDPTCGRYHECKAWKGSFYSIQSDCPPRSKFDPKHARCSSSYECNREFSCKKAGRFHDRTDDTNKRYILCSRAKDGHFIKTHYQCPANTKFDVELSLCTYHSEESSESFSESEELPEESWDHLDKSHCKERGYSGNPKDSKCRTYYICDVSGDGKLFKNILACPKGYTFDKASKLCHRGIACHH